MRVFCVHIDLACLREHLSRQENRELSQAEIERWLTEAGFTRSPKGWLVREKDLGQLEPDEVLEADVISPTDA